MTRSKQQLPKTKAIKHSLPAQQRFREVVRLAKRFRSHPEALERFLEVVQEDQATSAEDIAMIRNALLFVRKLDQTDYATYAMDRYLVGGVGAVDIVLLAVVIPLGMKDQATTIALFALAISLVLVGVSLFVGFIKQELKVITYGWIHGAFIASALISGFTALTATFWHISPQLGAFFGVLAFIAFAGCTLYSLLLRGLAIYKEEFETQSPETPEPETDSSPEPST